MKLHINTERKHACVLHSSDIKKLWTLLEDEVGTVCARIKCSDDGTREFDDLEELSLYENPPAKQIVSLYIRSHSDDWKKSVDVDFSNNEFSSIDISIEAQEQSAAEIRGRISDILDGTKPRYNYLALIHTSPLALTVVSFVVIFVSVIFAIYIWEDFLGFEYVRQLLHIFGYTVSILMGLGWLRRRLLPMCFFSLGQGEQRYRRLATTHKTILGLLATSIISLVVASIR